MEEPSILKGEAMNFMGTIRRLGRGSSALERRLDEALADVIQGVRLTNGKGSVTLKLEVAIGESEDGAQTVMVEPEISVKSPRPQVGGMSMYVMPDLTLSTRHPDQPEAATTDELSAAARAAARSAGEPAVAHA
jgi:hypothetical protein